MTGRSRAAVSSKGGAALLSGSLATPGWGLAERSPSEASTPRHATDDLDQAADVGTVETHPE